MEWGVMMLLGAFHGINPGMGWLFAVALAMQQGNERGVWRALPPIALGHGIAIAAVLLAAGLAELVVSPSSMKPVVASLLVTFGIYRLWRHRHPRFGGMQVGFRDLTVWSFLMASAHGAGVMVLPVVLGLKAGALAAGRAGHAGHMVAAGPGGPWLDAMAVGVHTAAYLAATALAALLVYRKLGLGLLRKAWFNLDWLWAASLVLTGSVALLA
jgi:hypothetical protein